MEARSYAAVPSEIQCPHHFCGVRPGFRGRFSIPKLLGWQVRWAAGYLACILLAALPQTISAQHPAGDYPNKPVRVVVPFAPGASTDLIARLLGQKLAEAWGQQFIVDNRGGAGR